MNNSFNELFKFIENNNEKNKTSNSIKKKKLMILVDILAILLLVGGGYGIKYVYDQKQDEKDAQELTKRLQEEEKKEQQEKNSWAKKTNKYRNFEELKAKNPDTVAWLVVPGTTIDMPIVKTTNNKFYLSHDYDRKLNQMGWVFADKHSTFPELSTNTIMYGHTYRRTTMFSNLKNVLEDKWLNNEKKHIITFDTEKERLKFKVFSVYTKEATNDYLYTSFSKKEDYQKYIDREIKRSIKDFKEDVTTNDKIITLSTCYISDEQRLIVHAKLISKE